MHSRGFIYMAPVLGILVVGGALLWSLNPERNPSEVQSVLVDNPIPEFELPQLEGAGLPGFSSTDLQLGQVTLVNIFASWCFPCRAEHPFLMRLSKEFAVPIYGINYKDKPADAAGWLAEFGNPYVAIGGDEDGRVTIDWGVYGIPETFVIDRAGVIRYRHVGPLLPKVLEQEILPLIRSLREAKA